MSKRDRGGSPKKPSKRGGGKSSPSNKPSGPGDQRSQSPSKPKSPDRQNKRGTRGDQRREDNRGRRPSRNDDDRPSGGGSEKSKRYRPAQRVKNSPRRVREDAFAAAMPFEDKRARPARESSTRNARDEGSSSREPRSRDRTGYGRNDRTQYGRHEPPGARDQRPSKGKSRERKSDDKPEAAKSRRPSKPRELVAGMHPVEAMIRHRADACKVLFADTGTPAVDALCALARRHSVTVQERTKEQLDAMSRGVMHQRVILETRHFPYVDFAERKDDASLIVALDGVEDPRNLGRVARASAVFGVDFLTIKKDRSVKVGIAAHKASAGAFGTLDVALADNLARAIDQAKEANFWVYGADESGDVEPDELDLSGKVMWVIGGENSGLSALSRKKCDRVVRIPMASESLMLNAADAATVLLYETARQRSKLEKEPEEGEIEGENETE